MVDNVVGVIKAYITRVGEGPPTELKDELGAMMWRAEASTAPPPAGQEGGWFDAVRGAQIGIPNGYTELALTKMDVLTGINP